VAALGRKRDGEKKSVKKKGLLKNCSNAVPSGRMWRLLSGYLAALPSPSIWSLLSGSSDAGLEVVPSGRVWRRVDGQGFEIELVSLGTDDDPNAIYISEELLMNECQVNTFY